MEELEILRQEAAELGIELNEAQLALFQKFYHTLIETNKVMNLTAITEPREVVVKHFLDSLSLAKVICPGNKTKIFDMGTGAGFPGIPLKIAFPETELVLADSLNKRIKFINQFIEDNRIEKISAVHGRAEDLARNPEYREKFDLCVSRAVANLSTLAEYCLPFVKVGGAFVSYKSVDVDQEEKAAQKAIKLLGGKVEKTEKFLLGPDELPRCLIVVRKTAPTPKKYPRKAGTPGKEPL